MTDNAVVNAPYYEEGQDLGHALLNEWLQRLAWLARPIVEDINENDADNVTPTDGQAWYVATGVGAGDAWEGQEGNIALYYSGWLFIPVVEGMVISVLDEQKIKVWNSASAWEDVHTWT